MKRPSVSRTTGVMPPGQSWCGRAIREAPQGNRRWIPPPARSLPIGPEGRVETLPVVRPSTPQSSGAPLARIFRPATCNLSLAPAGAILDSDRLAALDGVQHPLRGSDPVRTYNLQHLGSSLAAASRPNLILDPSHLDVSGIIKQGRPESPPHRNTPWKNPSSSVARASTI